MTWNDEDDMKLEDKANRIIAFEGGFDNKDHGTSYDECHAAGDFDSNYEYDIFVKGLMKLNNHDCQNASGRCHKRRDRETREMVCRVPRQDGYDKATFVPAEVSRVYDPESATILRELTKDKYLRVDGEGHFQFSPGEEAGLWHYESEFKDKKDRSTPVATIPRVAFFMKSATNVALVDPKFGPGYTTKYLGGMDEKHRVNLQGPSPSDVEAVEQPLENLKITGQRIISEQEAKKRTGPLVRRVAYTDICFDMLRLPYVTSTEDFRHYSNKYPEHRHAMRKYGRPGNLNLLHLCIICSD